MSEIKFACPHCRQHIICDSDYGGLPIDCPDCKGSLLVPRLPGKNRLKSDVVLMGLPILQSGNRSETSPPADFWTEAAWERNVRTHAGPLTKETRSWLVVLICAMVLAALVLIQGRNPWLSLLILMIGGVISVCLFPKGDEATTNARIAKAIIWIFAVIVGLPLLMLAFLFAACAGCK